MRREDDRANVVWDGFETCGRSPRRVLKRFASWGRPICEVEGSDSSSELLTGGISGCMVLE